MVADVIRDFEFDLTSLTLRPFDDGRFKVFKDGSVVFDMERTGKFPKYDQDVKPKL